ncbi:hypothetical protein EV183_000785 [Coemansia sp. RSA 2336]|nr:hypothetical protein EV183_000785 [Coemansia sp. RSA 2336]
MVYSLYDKAKVPECLTKLATGHSSLKIDDWDGYVISTCIHKDDIFLFVGYLSHIRQFCTFNDISTDSMGIVGIQLGNSMMAPVHTNNPELEHNAFVFVG